MSDQKNDDAVNHVNHNQHEVNHETLVHVEIEEADYENGLDLADNTLHDSTEQREPSPTTSTSGLRLKESRNGSGKRTTILPHQRVILENFFNTGMNSASNQLRHLHEAAADQTGLDQNVIKNWVRNRRRPSGVQRKHDNMLQMLTLIPQAHTSTCAPTSSSSSTSPPPLTIVTSSTPIPSTSYTVPMSSSSSSSHVPPPLCTPPEPKRLCIDRKQQTNYNNLSVPLIVKARIANSDETDFVEVEVDCISYMALLRSTCEELDVSIEDVVKIRKLPNVLIRKDKDVSRMIKGQEIEVVLSSLPSTTICPNCSLHYTEEEARY